MCLVSHPSFHPYNQCLRVLRWLCVVRLHGRPGRELLLLGALRRQSRAATGDLRGPGLYGGAVHRFRALDFFLVGPGLSVRGLTTLNLPRLFRVVFTGRPFEHAWGLITFSYRIHIVFVGQR